MNIVNFLVRFYGIQHKYRGLPTILQSPLRIVTRKMADRLLPAYLSKPYAKSGVESEIIVSLTSFPARINDVWQVIECMKRQTIRPAKIILWLSKEQFPDENQIPASLRDRMDGCFEIRLVDDDIRSHKKHYYVSQEFSDNLIFLVDDDLYYKSDLLERMLEVRNRNGKCVVCNYGYIVPYDKDRNMMPYNVWPEQYSYSEDNELFFGSGGGTLYRPSEMFADLTNKDLFLSLTPSADDVWLNAMARLGGLKRIMLHNGLPLPIAEEDNVHLSSTNVGQSQNDVQIKAVREYYKNKVF